MGLFKKDEPLEEYERFSARRQLMEDLTLTKNALDTAYANFETVVDPDLIDCYTYEIYSVQKLSLIHISLFLPLPHFHHS